MINLIIRKTQSNEIDTLLTIYAKAREFMEQTGNGTQWQKGYPTREVLEEDIKEGHSYVCVEENEILATFNFFVGIEPTYNKTYEGEWLNNEPYGVIHRIAVAVHKRGVASFCIQWCLKQMPNIKIDTHRNNIPMQKTILKNNFQYCGIIKKPDGTERLAYQSLKI